MQNSNYDFDLNNASENLNLLDDENTLEDNAIDEVCDVLDNNLIK